VWRPRLLHLIIAAGVLLAFLSRGDHPSSDHGSIAPFGSAVVQGTGTAPGGAEADANAAALASVLARLRAEQDRAQATQQEPVALSEPPQTPVAAQLPTESTPPASRPFWPYTTPAGTRWDLRCAWSGCLLSIDLGSGQIANVQAAPQFGSLERVAMDERVDYVRGVIQQVYGAQVGLYRFTRDGRVFPIP
jgi:hypothetical protein